MYQALYRKYRPAAFADVVGQNPVTETLKNSLSAGKISHAYLFTGTRGTGKTTCAKILAAAVNCLNLKDGSPCGECEACRAIANGATDIVEMDAASNNGVADVRELKEQISFLPVSLKYRVYIIDEVHMLSDSAFNALLKTLEEPPAHVVFILATTEVHKLPATILSRCQRYDFKRIDVDTIKARLLYVAEKEGITLDERAAGLIASLADGGMRDALSILDQCAGCTDHITETAVSEICGMADRRLMDSFVLAAAEQRADGALGVISEAYAASVDMKKFCEEALLYFRDIMVLKTVKSPEKLIVATEEQLNTLRSAAEKFSLSRVMSAIEILSRAREAMNYSPRRSEMELAAIKLCVPESQADVSALLKRIETLERGVNAASGAVMRSTPPAAAEPPDIVPSSPNSAAKGLRMMKNALYKNDNSAGEPFLDKNAGKSNGQADYAARSATVADSSGDTQKNLSDTPKSGDNGRNMAADPDAAKDSKIGGAGSYSKPSVQNAPADRQNDDGNELGGSDAGRNFGNKNANAGFDDDYQPPSDSDAPPEDEFDQPYMPQDGGYAVKTGPEAAVRKSEARTGAAGPKAAGTRAADGNNAGTLPEQNGAGTALNGDWDNKEKTKASADVSSGGGAGQTGTAPQKKAVNTGSDDGFAAEQPLSEWPEILEIIKKRSMPLYGGLYGSKGYIKDGRVLIDSALSSFREMVNGDPKMRAIIKDAIKEVLGRPYNIGPYTKKQTEDEDPLAAFARRLN